MNHKQQKGICRVVLEAEKSKIKDLHPAMVSTRSHNMAEGQVGAHETKTKSSQMCNKRTLIGMDYSRGHCPMAQSPMKAPPPSTSYIGN